MQCNMYYNFVDIETRLQYQSEEPLNAWEHLQSDMLKHILGIDYLRLGFYLLLLQNNI